MVAFGKKLKENQIQEWKGYYIDYKFLKKKVNRYSQQLDVGTQDPSFVLWDFSKMLDDQIQKVVLFLLEEQGLLAHRLLSLGEQCSDLLQQGERASICKIEQGYRQVGQDLLRLVFFLEMNATGLRKILKKFDKRFGYRFTDYYVKTRANHPYSQLQQVFKQVGVGAVAGSISRNLAELRDHQGIYVSIYDQPILSNTDPLVDSINAAVNRLSNSTDFLEFLGRHAFIISGDSGQLEDYAAEEEFHFMSLLLNLVNAFLYMINTYIIVPTADSYSLNLGAAATVCGVVIGSMAVAQLFSSIYFSAWSNRSYLRPLVFSSTVLLIGNTLYALAYDINSITVLLVGRLFCGLGSARAISRRYISDCVPLKFRMKASAAFVSASALGMACGPALACLFQTNFKIFNLTFNEDTLPGWFMALAWLFYLLWLWMSFKEPVREIKEGVVPQEGPSAKYTFKKNLEAPLLLQAEAKQEMSNEDEDCEEDSEEDHEPVTSLVSAYRILSPSVKVQLFVYFMLKYAMEILLAECSVVSTYYFEWPTKTVAVFLGFLGLTVLPVNVIVGHYISNMFEERQVVVASEIMLCIGILFSFNVFVPYTVIQYIGSAFVTFVSAEVLEGVNLSVLSRVMPSRLSRGTYNGGLLSTEAGTLARVVADATITLSGHFPQSWLLNLTLIPSLVICFSSIVATSFSYNSLY
ncbi:PREDICTED: SPX domain-containing membrane protein At4g22990-like [Tarenaya hassleriana]|uniref:SPX domain-containing membrane protein At4g22990-like n=1 Tax=Tarenaya hassleriana TaxID=28532 RepID=UPI00053C7C71|nr:PREDICTED: SPX domain-containing membrane protein At4g22990-like [Tarenaya hassleriana]